MTDVDAAPEFNVLDPAFAADPYPTYRHLREMGRLLQAPLMGGRPRPPDLQEEGLPNIWIVTHYEDCLMLLRDNRTSADPTRSQLYKLLVSSMLGGEGTPAVKLIRSLLLFMDPPDHTRLRSLVNTAFSRRAVEELRPRINTLVDGLLDDRDEIDLVADFAYPLPVTVIAEMLGVPLADQEMFGRWSRELVDLFGIEEMSPESMDRGNAAILAMNDYFAGLADERRHQPR
jgi:cytochrome P450